MRAAEDARTLLGTLDPANDWKPDDGAARQQELARILARTPAEPEARRPVGHRVSRRGALLGTAAAGVTTVAWAVVLNSSRPPAGPTYAATPRLLTYQRPKDPATVSAAERLEAIAKRTATQPPMPKSADSAEHIVTNAWYLHSAVANGRTTSAVVPEQREIWRTADDRGRVVTRELEPIFNSKRQREEWEDRFGRAHDETPQVRDYDPGGFPASFAGRPPAQPSVLKGWLRAGANLPADGASVAVLEHLALLATERVLMPTERTAMLRVVGDLPGLTYDGIVVDRAGRAGEGYSIASDYHGLWTVYTMIVDPTDGNLLGYEEMLTRTAGKLNVRIPAVTTYVVYLTANRVPAPW